MRKYIFISIGGMLGAVLRYSFEGVKIYNYHENIPLNTLFINICGSFLLALFLTVTLEILKFDADIRIGVATGFMGAFTTFSTFCKETVGLIYEGDYSSAILYITVSTMLGLAVAYLGIVIAREVISKFKKA